MTRVALYVGAAGYIVIAIVLAMIFSLDVDIFIGNARFESVNILAGAIVCGILAGVMLMGISNTPS